MKKILFINPGPFGSLTDTYYYCLILKDKYNITYLGFDENKTTQKIDGIKIIHLRGASNTIKQKYIFLRTTLRLLKDNRYNFILISYFVGSSIIKLMSKRELVIDIRTGNITSNKYKRILYNVLLGFEIRCFNNISIISESLLKYLQLRINAHILPLGALSIPFVDKDFKTLKILYVGTFYNRNIVNTIYAFAKFISNKEDKDIAKYTIIGNGSDLEIRKIIEAITTTGMEKFIDYIGVIRYPELIRFLEIHNVGMSYIPMNSYYDNQPPTKTFEYLLSGMAVLATGTRENKKVITNKNGIITGDTIDDISKGLEYIYKKRFNFDSKEIQMESKKYSWEYIVNENLIPYIESF